VLKESCRLELLLAEQGLRIGPIDTLRGHDDITWHPRRAVNQNLFGELERLCGACRIGISRGPLAIGDSTDAARRPRQAVRADNLDLVSLARLPGRDLGPRRCQIVAGVHPPDIRVGLQHRGEDRHHLVFPIQSTGWTATSLIFGFVAMPAVEPFRIPGNSRWRAVITRRSELNVRANTCFVRCKWSFQNVRVPYVCIRTMKRQALGEANASRSHNVGWPSCLRTPATQTGRTAKELKPRHHDSAGHHAHPRAERRISTTERGAISMWVNDAGGAFNA